MRVNLTAELAPSMQRLVRIAPVDADAATRELATDLASAISDGLAAEPTIRVLKDSATEVVEETIEATLRAAGDRVRARLRIVDRKGDIVWADRVEGTLGDPFALEDAVCSQVLAALRTRASRGGGPTGAVRERYETARAQLAGDLESIRLALATLEELDREVPDDPWIMSQLACAHMTAAMRTGASDEVAFGRAEELALRALDRDPTNGQAFYAIAVIRSAKGDNAGAIAAAREALRRIPLHARAHFEIGRVLCWSNRVAEGLQRMELAMRLDPTSTQIMDEKVRTLALVGDRPAAERELVRIERVQGDVAIVARLRLYAWWRDRDLARETAALIASSRSGGSWMAAGPLVDAYARGEEASALDYVIKAMTMMTSARVIPRQRGLMHEIATENFILVGAPELALQHLAHLAALPGFIDLLWMDRCPLLVELHKHAEFAQARAAVAERVAQLFD
jgi:serine/threonine-protein kinase